MTITGAGTVVVEADQAGDATHSAATPVQQSLTVNPATIVVQATSFSQPQGTALPSTLPFTITGLVSPDITTGAPTLTTNYTTASPIGQTYTIFVAQNTLAVFPSSSAGNYTFDLENGMLTVGGGSSQTITFPALPANITYGSQPIPLNAISSAGLPITYTATGSAVVTGSATSGWTLSIISAGQGTVTATQGGNAQYAAAMPLTQVFSVKPAMLTVAATSFHESYGSMLPVSLPYTVSGLVSPDQLGGMPDLGTTYVSSGTPGTTYPITINQGSLVIEAPALPGNYVLNLVPGTITADIGANTITFPAIPNTAYGSTIMLNAKASSGLPITYTVTGNATLSNSALTIIGIGSVSVKATQPGNLDYAAATAVTQNFMATQATLTVAAGFYTRPQGAVNPTFSATISGFVNGDANTPLVLTGAPTITTLATPASAPGTYAVTPAMGSLESANYAFTFVQGQLVVTDPPSYIITASPNALTIPIGQARQSGLQVESSNDYVGSVTFSCGQVPLGITCNFSPATVNITAIPGTPLATNVSTLTVSTSVTSAQLRTGGSNTVMAGIFLLPGGLAGLFLVFPGKRIAGNVRLRQLLVLVVMLSAAMGMGACASSSNLGVAPMGNSTLLITATGTGTPGTGSQNVTNILYMTVDVVPLQQQNEVATPLIQSKRGK